MELPNILEILLLEAGFMKAKVHKIQSYKKYLKKQYQGIIIFKEAQKILQDKGPETKLWMHKVQTMYSALLVV